MTTSDLGGGYTAAAPQLPEGVNPYGQGKCPECGVDLSTVDARKHAISHWGTDPIAFEPRTRASTLLARQRRAVLMGENVPTD